jgi:arylsulfatase A-like enzyme
MDRSIGILRNHLKAGKLDKNTLLWYCGDNGTPPSADRVGMTIRAQKGSLYEGGILVPGVLEWPARIQEGRHTSVPAVTSDFLPTLCALTGQPLPDRSLDGVNLAPIIDGELNSRPEPIFFWEFETGQVFGDDPRPYIDPQLQEGTTPLAKMMAGKYTRSFRNYYYTDISDSDFGGARAMTDNRYKLLIGMQSGGDERVELYDLIEDRAEQNDLSARHPDIVNDMKKRMHDWQQSVLESLTGADY